MTDHKLIFIGPVGSGKTTAITTLSDNGSLTTDAKASDITGTRKQTTTVALDYGDLTLTSEHKLKLYGTPGQIRFSFMWDLLTNHLAASSKSVVLLLDNTRNYPQRDLKFYATEFAALLQRSKLVIGITRSDLRNEPNLANYQAWTEELGIDADIRFVDARNRTQMLSLVKTAMDNQIPDEAWSEQFNKSALHDCQPLEPSSTETFEVTDYRGEHVVIKDSIVEDILKIKGVEGAVLTNSMGDILTSSMDDPMLEEYIGFMAGMVPAFQAASAFDTARSILIKSPTGSNLAVFIEDQQVLGVLSTQRTSTRTLKQQVEDILQWD